MALSLAARAKVPYEPGVLVAVALDSTGARLANRSIVTAGAAARLELHVDREEMRADRGDLAYVSATVVDAAGHRVWASTARVAFEVDGVAELAAIGSGDPQDPSSFRAGARAAFRGRCVAILRPGSATAAPRAGDVRLTARAPGLGTARIDLRVVS